MPCCTPSVRHWASVISDFVTSGRLLDLSVALVIGGTFTKVIEALVDHLLTPIFGFLFDGTNIADLKATLKSDRWPHKAPVTLPYGLFLKELLYFVIVVISLSMLITVINKIKQARQRSQIYSEMPTRQN